MLQLGRVPSGKFLIRNQTGAISEMRLEWRVASAEDVGGKKWEEFQGPRPFNSSGLTELSLNFPVKRTAEAGSGCPARCGAQAIQERSTWMHAGTESLLAANCRDRDETSI